MIRFFLISSLAFVSQLAVASPKRLIELAPGVQKWMTSEQLANYTSFIHETGRCGGFLDVTDNLDFPKVSNLKATDFATRQIINQKFVDPLLNLPSYKNLTDTVTKLSSWRDRYFNSANGASAAAWIFDQFTIIGKGHSNVTVEYFTNSFKQPNVIARIKGSSLATQKIILGGHMDTINAESGSPSNYLPSPGADDDASGVATLIETFKILVESGYQPERTIEFIAYAGEEKGLLGSQAIAKKYALNKADVFAVFQLDMTMFNSDGIITFINNDVDNSLTTYTELLIDTYLKVPHQRDTCVYKDIFGKDKPYACSDHASWTKAGYPSVFPFESAFKKTNHNIHSQADKLDVIDPVYGVRFAKLAVAWATELSSDTIIK